MGKAPGGTSIRLFGTTSASWVGQGQADEKTEGWGLVWQPEMQAPAAIMGHPALLIQWAHVCPPAAHAPGRSSLHARARPAARVAMAPTSLSLRALQPFLNSASSSCSSVRRSGRAGLRGGA